MHRHGIMRYLEYAQRLKFFHMGLTCIKRGQSRRNKMLVRYFVTFLDIAMCLCILFFAKNKKDKASIIGFGTMILAYAGSAFLMWN